MSGELELQSFDGDDADKSDTNHASTLDGEAKSATVQPGAASAQGPANDTMTNHTAKHDAHLARVRKRVRGKCGCGGSITDLGELGGMGVEGYFRILVSAVQTLVLCTLVSLPLLIVNWARVRVYFAPPCVCTLCVLGSCFDGACHALPEPG